MIYIHVLARSEEMTQSIVTMTAATADSELVDEILSLGRYAVLRVPAESLSSSQTFAARAFVANMRPS
jgi:hypothetical protein